MNQGWSWHYVEYIKQDIWMDYYWEATITKKINTKKRRCYDSNHMQMTNCLNEFYMTKMNCTFPWLKTNFGSLEKCGNKHYIDDFKSLIDNVVMNGKIDPDSKKCLIPNCAAIKWKSKKHTFNHPDKETLYMSFIDSNLKVNVDIFSINYCFIF